MQNSFVSSTSAVYQFFDQNITGSTFSGSTASESGLTKCTNFAASQELERKADSLLLDQTGFMECAIQSWSLVIEPNVEYQETDGSESSSNQMVS